MIDFTKGREGVGVGDTRVTIADKEAIVRERIKDLENKLKIITIG